MTGVLRFIALCGLFVVVLVAVPFVLFQANNNHEIPIVLGIVLVVCMLLLLPKRKATND